MKRENPLPFLAILLTLVCLSGITRAQVIPEPDSLLQEEELVHELERIEELTSYGPHYKNKLAAGRLLTINRAVPPLPDTYSPDQLFGPAYKNRHPNVSSEPANAAPQPTRDRRTGPRYKNRGAKSGNL